MAATVIVSPLPDGPWDNVWTPQGTSPEALAEFAGRLCYQSWRKPNPKTATVEGYMANILQQKHYSILEHASFTVLIRGISRSCSHELVRHRHLSFSQLSQRFVPASKSLFVVPPDMRGDEELEGWLRNAYFYNVEVFSHLHDLLKEKKGLPRKRLMQAARAVMPNMIATETVVTGNHRAWREFFEKRGSPHADEEIREVAVEIFGIARNLAPSIYSDMDVADGCIVARERKTEGSQAAP